MAIREARVDDRNAILELVRAAFSTEGRDGQDEVDIVVGTWNRAASPAGMDLVAIEDDAVVGHVLASVGEADGRPVLGIAPLAVAPAHQGAGVGSALMRELIARADAAGEPMLVLLGNPAYYGRFGFEPASAHGLVYPPVGPDSPYFQVRRLTNDDPTIEGDYLYCWELPVTLP
ncbi:MAG TPA: N-acetyltransferase [Acidimicrobiales bacterium]|nr:N-acetyltransferase [Acidimicrobiales bacterium]